MKPLMSGLGATVQPSERQTNTSGYCCGCSGSEENTILTKVTLANISPKGAQISSTHVVVTHSVLQSTSLSLYPLCFLAKAHKSKLLQLHLSDSSLHETFPLFRPPPVHDTVPEIAARAICRLKLKQNKNSRIFHDVSVFFLFFFFHDGRNSSLGSSRRSHRSRWWRFPRQMISVAGTCPFVSGPSEVWAAAGAVMSGALRGQDRNYWTEGGWRRELALGANRCCNHKEIHNPLN